MTYFISALVVILLVNALNTYMRNIGAEPKRFVEWVKLYMVEFVETFLNILWGVRAAGKFIEKVSATRVFRLLLWFSYFYSQNSYFGCNKEPMSDTELITDGIWMILLMLALIPFGNNTVIIHTSNNEDKS